MLYVRIFFFPRDDEPRNALELSGRRPHVAWWTDGHERGGPVQTPGAGTHEHALHAGQRKHVQQRGRGIRRQRRHEKRRLSLSQGIKSVIKQYDVQGVPF